VTKNQKILSALGGGAVVMFLAGYLIATRILFPPLAEPENGIVVPSLTGLTVPQAQARLRRLGLRLTETMDVPTAQTPGLIIAQSPLAGQQLRELGAVKVGIAAPLPAPPPAPAPAPAPDSVTLTDTAVVTDTVTPADTVSF
jgi:beta-lactam-binding protein with PASTA domain